MLSNIPPSISNSPDNESTNFLIEKNEPVTKAEFNTSKMSPLPNASAIVVDIDPTASAIFEPKLRTMFHMLVNKLVNEADLGALKLSFIAFPNSFILSIELERNPTILSIALPNISVSSTLLLRLVSQLPIAAVTLSIPPPSPDTLPINVNIPPTTALIIFTPILITEKNPLNVSRTLYIVDMLGFIDSVKFLNLSIRLNKSSAEVLGNTSLKA